MFFCFRQKTAYELRISDWSSDVCSSDLSAFQPEDVQLCYQIAVHGRRDLPWAPDPRLGFEMTVLRMAAFRPDDGSPAPTSAGPSSASRTGGDRKSTRLNSSH